MKSSSSSKTCSSFTSNKWNKHNKNKIEYLTPSGGFGFRENLLPPGAQGTAHLEI